MDGLLLRPCKAFLTEVMNCVSQKSKAVKKATDQYHLVFTGLIQTRFFFLNNNNSAAARCALALCVLMLLLPAVLINEMQCSGSNFSHFEFPYESLNNF